jgi:hypothetical protein
MAESPVLRCGLRIDPAEGSRRHSHRTLLPLRLPAEARDGDDTEQRGEQEQHDDGRRAADQRGCAIATDKY